MNAVRRQCGLVVFLLLAGTVASGRRSAEGAPAFELEEVPGFGVGGAHLCPCTNEAADDVTYPAFSSGKPRCGQLTVDMTFGDPQSGALYHFAIDESGGTGAGYDRLYIDLNRDGDLSGERALTPLHDVPEGALLTRSWIEQQVCFDYVTFSSVGDANEMFSTETMPRLTVSDKGYAMLWFVATKARRGRITIGVRHFDVVMSNGYPMGTRWDRPETSLELRSRHNASSLPRGILSDRLMAMHKIDGTYWCLSTTPTGGRLFVAPYDGDFGILRMGSSWGLGGKRGFAGTLMARDKAVIVGDDARLEPVRSCRIPVGDYTPAMAAVYQGPLLLDVSENYHADGKLRQRDAPLAYALKVRKDKPCVLNFSRKAEVLFALPARGTRLKPGEELVVNAVLVDPRLDIMIRGLRRKSSAAHDMLSPGAAILMAVVLGAPLVIWLFAGGARRRYRFVPILSISGLVVLAGLAAALQIMTEKMNAGTGDLRAYHDKLTPQVIVCRSDGEIVAGGGMPFG